RVNVGTRATEIIKLAEAHRMNFRGIDEQTIGISLDETTSEKDVLEIWRVFNGDRAPDFTLNELASHINPNFPPAHARKSEYLTQPVFNQYHSETEMMRYLKRLESRDLSLATSMIPLGSCTMKLNAAVE